MGRFGRLVEGAAGNALWAAVVAVSIAAWSYLASEQPHRIAVLALVTLAAVFFILEQVRAQLARPILPEPVPPPRDLAAEIREWIRRTGASLAEVPNRGTVFNFAVTDRQKNHVNVFQPDNQLDRVILGTVISGPAPVDSMPADKRTDFLWRLRFGFLNMGVSFAGIQTPWTEVRLSTSISVDELTMPELVSRMERIQRAVLFLQWNLLREVEGAGGPASQPTAMDMTP